MRSCSLCLLRFLLNASSSLDNRLNNKRRGLDKGVFVVPLEYGQGVNERCSLSRWDGDADHSHLLPSIRGWWLICRHQGILISLSRLLLSDRLLIPPSMWNFRTWGFCQPCVNISSLNQLCPLVPWIRDVGNFPITEQFCHFSLTHIEQAGRFSSGDIFALGCVHIVYPSATSIPKLTNMVNDS